ncbi:hypothetical protein KY290_017158 [Solanum tuberosum]|uniref:Uncharacterized protein n=1 Tax=Solanum tuberosum TaxID=4113 RepID=A0ABQ7VAI6_SOLTU|nr:hypothetical protein KY284_016189 [Solanum tuberosum]KAH0701917.1 hypothetical protein KY285_016195 [Solanum tuberosum]KAH0761085.1 hypothetical protein KY290_017158 [Solanum tuberosum]
MAFYLFARDAKCMLSLTELPPQQIGFLKYDVAEEITANVVDRNNGCIVTTSSTVEHSVKQSLECGRTCNAKAAAIVGEVLAMRLKVEGKETGSMSM